MKQKLIVIFLILTVLTNAKDLKYWDSYKASGEKYQVDPYVLYAIAETESGNDSSVISGEGITKSVGLMQIRSLNYSETTLLNPSINIDLGAKKFKECKQFFDNQREAIDCYRVGLKKARRDTMYVKRVEMILKQKKIK